LASAIDGNGANIVILEKSFVVEVAQRNVNGCYNFLSLEWNNEEQAAF
jgi:hypothetical protein